MTQKVVNYLIWSQITLFGGLGVCVVLIPKFLTEHNEGGVSNYGVHARTVLPYSLAFLLCGGFVMQAARLLTPATKALRQLQHILYIFVGLLLLVLATTYPYKLNGTFEELHILSAITMFCFEMGASVWLALRLHRDMLSGLLLAGQLSGFILGFLTFIGTVHLLFIAQIITSLMFGLLLIQTARQLMHGSRTGA